MSELTSGALVAAAREYALQYAERRAIAKRDAELKKSMAALGEQIGEEFLSLCLDAVKIDGGKEVHRYSESWPALIVPEGMTDQEARAAAVRTLQECGHGDMVTFNHVSVRGLVNSMADEDGALPPPLGDYLRAAKSYKIGVRGGGK